jgi:hypothetical protein
VAEPGIGILYELGPHLTVGSHRDKGPEVLDGTFFLVQALAEHPAPIQQVDLVAHLELGTEPSPHVTDPRNRHGRLRDAVADRGLRTVLVDYLLSLQRKGFGLRIGRGLLLLR